MGNDVAEEEGILLDPRSFKVHRSMCIQLLKLVDRISWIFPEIEKARPRCSTGIQALCSLQTTIEKAKLLLQHCSESSKLYLVITGDVILARCQRSRKLFEQSLVQIQSMVSVMLAAKIAQIIDDLSGAVFILESSEEEAGRNMQELLKQDASASDSMESSEIKALQFAALKLHITTPKALLIEKRSIKKLLDKTSHSDPKKGRILKYLLYLLRTHGQIIMMEQTESTYEKHEESFSIENYYNNSTDSKPIEVESHIAGYARYNTQTDVFGSAIPPEEFKCPISLRLMYDPVIIASGQTFERVWMQKWLDEGNVTCPKTKMRLTHHSLTPNTGMKDLISRWCTKNGISIPNPNMQSKGLSWETSSASIASFGSSMNDFHLQIDVSNMSLGSLDTSYGADSFNPKIADGLNLVLTKTSDDSQRCPSDANMNEADLETLSSIAELQWESQCKVVEDARTYLKVNDQICHSMQFDSAFAQLIRFLTEAHDRHDVKAQKSGCQLLLNFVSKSRSGIPSLHEDAFSLLTWFLDSDAAEEALAIMGLFSGHHDSKSKIAVSGALTFILNNLDSKTRDFQEPAIKILYNLSSNRDICSQIVSLDYIPKLVPLLSDPIFTRYCITILRNLCDIEEGRSAVVETKRCISSVAEILEIGDREDQEHAVSILLSLCSQRDQYCQLVLDEGVIPALVDISINGNDNGKAGAMELLRLLRDINYGDETESYATAITVPKDSGNPSKEKKSSSKASGFFGGKISIFSSHSSKKKK